MQPCRFWLLVKHSIYCHDCALLCELRCFHSRTEDRTGHTVLLLKRPRLGLNLVAVGWPVCQSAKKLDLFPSLVFLWVRATNFGHHVSCELAAVYRSVSVMLRRRELLLSSLIVSKHAAATWVHITCGQGQSSGFCTGSQSPGCHLQQ